MGRVFLDGKMGQAKWNNMKSLYSLQQQITRDNVVIKLNKCT